MAERKQSQETIEMMKEKYGQVEMTTEQMDRMKSRMEKARQDKRGQKKKRMLRRINAAAAAVAAFILLPNLSGDVAYAMGRIPVLGKLVEVVTFRDYQYESERHKADIQVPELVADDALSSDTDHTEDAQVQENIKKTTEEINAEIQKISDQIVTEFEENKKDEEGYQDVMIKHEVINTTQDYFTLKLICFQASGSGAEWDYFYTIDLNTGERLELKNLFKDGADYITPISENIKEQMRQQMKEDDMMCYWVDEDIEEMNFKSITDDTSFYINAQNHIVIAFDEYEVAPGYMGCVEFEIPDAVIADIRK